MSASPSVSGPIMREMIGSNHFRLKKNMSRIGGFHSFNTARRSIQGFEVMLGLRKDFGFAGAWTVHDQNRLLGLCEPPRVSRRPQLLRSWSHDGSNASVFS